MKDFSVEKILALNVRIEGTKRNVVAFLMSPGDGFKQWAGAYNAGSSGELVGYRALARSIAAAVSMQIK